jgi:peptide/nickel transport system permease protein
VLALVYLVAVFPDFFAMYPPSRQHRQHPYARPGAYGDVEVTLFGREDPEAPLRLMGTRGSGQVFLLGADEFGRDVYSRVCHGASFSLLLAPAALAVSLLLALALGGAAGYAGGSADSLLMRLGEIFLSLPWFYFVLALRAALPLHLPPARAAFMLFLLLGILGWAAPARLFRGLTLTLKASEFVLAAQALGAGSARIFLRHLLPGLLPAARTQFLLSLPAYILMEVNLSFLGLGILDPAPTLGNMLTPLQQYFVLSSYPWMLAPAVALVVVCLALHTVAHAQ